MRRRWQSRFNRVIVDEHKDMELAQEMLVQMLAAPQDSLFVVGDEDQVLYGWRRASALRIVGLDQVYPGLERVALATNYRCPPTVVERSAQLIGENRIRFPKEIKAAPGRIADPSAVSLDQHGSRGAAATWTAQELRSRGRGEVVVLARTTRLLAEVAQACVEPRILISGPAAIFEARGARAAIEAHFRLAA